MYTEQIIIDAEIYGSLLKKIELNPGKKSEEQLGLLVCG